MREKKKTQKTEDNISEALPLTFIKKIPKTLTTMRRAYYIYTLQDTDLISKSHHQTDMYKINNIACDFFT
jgi:hypothetical protein